VPRRSGERARLALDASCLVALLCDWHEHHFATLSAVEGRLESGARLAVAAPVLVETYSVLTRLPAPQRLSPGDAFHLLAQNFEEKADAVTLGADEYWSLLRTGPTTRVYGGRIYDAVIAACARKAGARELLTLNRRDFESFADESLFITSPA
jgi:predicted nucleic acid-binding protein